MSRRDTAQTFLRTFGQTLRDRLRRGPMKPGWSLLYEAVARTTRVQWTRPRPVPARRAWFDQIGSLGPKPPVQRRRAALGGQTVEWQVPRHVTSSAPVVLYSHGGGYNIGSIASHRPLTMWLAQDAGVRLASLEYRLAPEHPCPAGIDDLVAAYRALIREVDPGRVFLAGDSAGGGLTLAAAPGPARRRRSASRRADLDLALGRP